MKNKILCVFLMLYLLVTSSAIFMLQNNLYSLKTASRTTGRKVCLILIDGLRYDGIKNMDFLQELLNSKSAVLYKSHSGTPSFSRPGYERILTGTDSLVNGVSSNKKAFPSLTPNLFSLSKKNGLKTAAASYYWIKQLYPLSIDKGYYYFIRDGITFKEADRFITENKPDFLLVHPMSVDNAGHNSGGNSLEYSEAVRAIDEDIRTLWNKLKINDYSVIITSDHGHRNEGGHGDDSIESTEVPLVIWSSKPSDLKPSFENKNVTQMDIAPTVSDILGIQKTIYMYGNSLVNHNDEMSNLRSYFGTSLITNFPKFFKLSSSVTYFIISSFTIAYMGCCFIIIKLLKYKI